MNPAFLTLGRIMTHSDLFSRAVGIPFGELIRYLTTLPESVTLCCSLALCSSAMAGRVTPRTAAQRHKLAAIFGCEFLLDREICSSLDFTQRAFASVYKLY